MNGIESILSDLKSLPALKLMELAQYIHGLTETAQKERRALLRQTHGALSPEDGEAFEQAVTNCRRLDE